ncbi:hypothetical protein B0T42_07050 [Rathayibacter sp. VKM Ac-2630]|nr:hypothetical protein B0T42_07050 [Rathayibacter sp. VKM Ac-2630]
MRKCGVGALALTTVLLLTGCSGDSFRADFARTFGSDEAVADLELSTVEDMPFTGGVSAEVVARENLADATCGRSPTDSVRSRPSARRATCGSCSTPRGSASLCRATPISRTGGSRRRSSCATTCGCRPSR